MRLSILRSHQGRWLLLATALVWQTPGCTWLETRWDIDKAVAAHDSAAKEALAASLSDASSEQPPESESLTLNASWTTALSDPSWVMTLPVDGVPAKERFRHAAIEPLLLEPLPRPALEAALSSETPVVRANAAIVLARAARTVHAEPLKEAARDRQLKLSLRQAAIETLGASAIDDAQQATRELLSDFGDFSEAHKAHYIPELHAELVHAIARHAESDDPAIVAALRSPSALPRLEAVGHWSKGRHIQLPDVLVDLRTDPDARVRAAVVGILAAHEHPQAMEHLQAALADAELNVRLAAIGALGILGDDTARKRLDALMTSDAEIVRAAAVAALAEMKADDAVMAAIHDKSWRVRVEVAKALDSRADSPLASLAMTLLTDSNALVQQQMVKTLATWPEQQAGPLLLTALEESGYLARKSARETLARQWPEAEEFVLDAPIERREKVLRDLRERFAAQFGASLENIASTAPLVTRASTTATPASDLALCLARLASGNVDERRRAADRLAELADKTTLSDEIVETIAATVTNETDPLLWRSALIAIAPNTSDAAFRLAYAGVSHPAAEVRRRACQHLANHGDPQHVDILLTALKDEDAAVVRAAARALGTSGERGDYAPLEELLLASDKSIRLEAAVSLARLESEKGPEALKRLALDNDPAVRRQAALAMGQLQDPAYTPALIQLLDDQGGVCQAALASLAQIAGRDVTRPEDPSEALPTTKEAIQRWKEWAAAGREGATAGQGEEEIVAPGNG